MDGTCSGDFLGQVLNSEDCCRSVVAGGLGGGGFSLAGDEVCTSCDSMIGISTSHTAKLLLFYPRSIDLNKQYQKPT